MTNEEIRHGIWYMEGEEASGCYGQLRSLDVQEKDEKKNKI